MSQNKKAMTFVIITHVPHIFEQQKYYAYAPYVREMNIWLKYVDEVIIVAPLHNSILSAIDSTYVTQKIDFREVSSFNINMVKWWCEMVGMFGGRKTGSLPLMLK